MNYQETIRFLYDLRLFGAKFGLENTRKLAALAGNPHQQFPIIHVAGTNGKGSTCAMLESIYRAAGYRVGLFTSPHLVSFAERIQVNRRLISEEDVVRGVVQIRSWMDQFPTDLPPTFFEVVTVLALRYFAEQKCDLVLLETGLGGRLDATNIVAPLASVITNIGIEHEQWLGDTIDKIASEKAGIIKPGIPVITGAPMGGGLEVIAAEALRLNSPLTTVTEADLCKPPLPSMRLSLSGHHQLTNAGVAIATVNALAREFAVSEAELRQGLSTVYWPGRLQHLKSPAGQMSILDGAHNPAGAEALRQALLDELSGAKCTLIFGVFQDKDWRSMCRSLVPLSNRIVLVPVHSDRTQNPTELVPYCRQLNSGAVIEVCASLAEAFAKTAKDTIRIVTGSIYLVGEALELLHLMPSPPNNERGLNESLSTGSVHTKYN